MTKRVTIDCVVRHETARAYLMFDGTVEAWVPKYDTDGGELVAVKTDGRGKVIACDMPEGLALRKGFHVDDEKTGDLFG